MMDIIKSYYWVLLSFTVKVAMNFPWWKVILMDSLELLCDGSDVLPLVEGLLQLELRRLPRAITSVSSGTIRASTLHLLHLEHASPEGVSDRNKYHPVVDELSYGSQPMKQKISSSVKSYGQ